MRKNATKLAAVALSLALTITSVNVAADGASAASKKTKLNMTKKTLYVGKKTTVKLMVKGKKTLKGVKFTSTKKSVATVSSKGVVKAKKAGKTTIKVTYKKKTYKCVITVKKKATATKAPATEAPATEAPATEAPATEAPTKEPSVVKEIVVSPADALTAKSATWQSGNDDLAYIHYDVKDQYGESIRTTESINWTTSPNYVANDTANGILTIKDDKGFTYGSSIFVTGVHVKTGVSVSTSVKVGAARAVDTIKFEGFLNKNDKTKIETALPADFAPNTYVLLYTAYDQNGDALDMSDTTVDDDLTFINDNPTLVDSAMNKLDTVYTVNGVEYAAIEVQPGIYVDKGGEVNITAISNKTGKKSTMNYQIGAAAMIHKLELSAPAGTVVDGETVEIPFKATAADGTAITNYESIVRSTNKLTLNASVGTLKLAENIDGTAKLTWKDAVEYADYANTTVAGLSSTFDGQDRSIALTTIVVGGVSDNMMLSVSDMRYPVAIEEVNYATTVVDETTGAAKIATVGSSTVKFVDQYNKVLDETYVNKFFAFTADNKFKDKFYGFKAVAKDERLIKDAANGKIVTGAGFSIPWTADLGEATGAETSNVKYTIVTTADGKEWLEACKAESVTSTILPISEVKNLTLSTSGTINITTAQSEKANGKSIEDQSVAIAPSGNTGAAKFTYGVTGKYKGTDVTVPASYVTIATGSSISESLAYVSTTELTWEDLYDFTTYNNPRKTGKATLKVVVNGTTLAAKADISDAEAELVNPNFKSLGDVVTPSLTVINVADFGACAMNQWWAGWTDALSNYTFDISAVEESTSELTHLNNSFTVSGNGTATPVIDGAEVGDKFTVTLTLDNGASVSKTVTVGPDAFAFIANGNDADATLRKALGYNR